MSGKDGFSIPAVKSALARRFLRTDYADSVPWRRTQYHPFSRFL